MKKEYSRAEIFAIRRIEKVLSEILSDKYDCKVKLRWLPEEYGEVTLAENERVHCICDGENEHRYVIVVDEPNDGGDPNGRAAANNHRELRKHGT